MRDQRGRAAARALISLAVTSLITAACARPVAQTASAPAPSPLPAEAGARANSYGVFETPAFARAVEAGTRTRTGRPGERYWQQRSEYRLEAELDPVSKRLTGRGVVRYYNASPDTLRSIRVHLRPNLFAPNAVRNEVVPVTGGMTLERIAAQGQTLAPTTLGDTTAGYAVDGTIAHLRLRSALMPGASAELEFAWSFVIPPDGAPRMGTDGEIFYIAYWYPQIAVYDDLSGWQNDQYMGNSEFYMGYGNYEVALTLPAGWLVGSTGVLQNPAEVLSATTRARLDSALHTPRVVNVVTEQDRVAGRSTSRGTNGKLTWRFRADSVRDFAFGASDKYLWDATHAVAGDANGDGRPDTAAIHSFYRPERRAWAWDQSARYVRHSIEFLSRFLWPYAYPHMTAVDGVVSCSGMEYPMMTCIGGRRDTLSLYSVTVHETAHMWFPMQVGSDEQRYAWQDEGLTRFNQAQAMREFFNGYDLERIARNQYLSLARQGSGSEIGQRGEVELMRHGDLYPRGSPAYGIASYAKMATNLAALRAIVGDEVFMRAYREYGRRWLNKHPAPYDLWNSFNEVSGQDLGWFWRTWFFETWTLDHAVADVRTAGDSAEIVIENRGRAPMPVRLAVTRSDGRVERVDVPVAVWLAGASRHTVRVSAMPAVTKVEIDPEERFPDIDRTNNAWRAESRN
ncbi:MAG: M1 family metallopeptidase [Gemmatimonadaceae bacterium]|nr:M1 family metallopeptidase [Gemmatimonadaceae bacterium]